MPRSAMVKQGLYRQYRKDLLEKNTLLAVINFPEDLFYPIGVQSCGIVVKKGIAHDYKQNVLWIQLKTDGLLKSKGKRLPSPRTTDEVEEKKLLIKTYIANPRIKIENIKETQKACPIEISDDLLELLPEVYLEEKRPSEKDMQSRAEHTLKETVSFMIMDNKIRDFAKNVITPKFFCDVKKPNRVPVLQEISITDIFQIPIKTGDYHVSGELDTGEIPLVSCSAVNNGFEGKFDVPISHAIKNAITIASDGQPLATYFHYYPFVAKDNVIIGIPNRTYRFTTLLFFATQLNELKWRFSYGRKCYLNKIHKIKIYSPFYDKKIDEDYIEYLFKTAPSWITLRKIFT